MFEQYYEKYIQKLRLHKLKLCFDSINLHNNKSHISTDCTQNVIFAYPLPFPTMSLHREAAFFSIIAIASQTLR